MKTRPRTLIALTSICFLSLLAGCSASFNPGPSSGLSAVGAIKGSVYGGQQGVSGSHVYVLQATTTGYGAASTSIIGNNGTTGYASDSIGSYVLTDRFGSFALTGDYSCTPGAQVYLLAEQGNPGLAAGTNNTAIGLMAAVGACPSTGDLSATVPTVTVNEVSTVVAAYALAGYATDATHISSSNTALAATGLANAAAAVPNMLSVATGTAFTATAATGSTGVVPQAEINTLADILASCVNASGPTAGNCPTLFANATADGTSGGAQPTETATAAINIAHHPAQAPATLYSLQPPTAPFLPVLSSAPNDFTLKIYYTGGGLDQSTQLAVDGSGNIWVASQGNSTLNKFSPVGVPLSGATGFTGGGLNTPYGVAIDTSGNAWVANLAGADVSEFSPAGASLAGTTGFTGNGDLTPYQLAIDGNGYVWATNFYSGTISKLSSAGTETLNANDAGNLRFPEGIAIDASNNVWVSDFAQRSTYILSNATGIELGGAGSDHTTDANPPRFIELTAGGSPAAWASAGAASILFDTPNAAAAQDTSYSGGGLSNSTSNILDGAGNIWVTNFQSGVVSELNSAGAAITPSTGYTTTLTSTFGIAVDGSGNVWVTDNGTTSGTMLAEFVGAATPTVTPLVQAVINNNIAGKP